MLPQSGVIPYRRRDGELDVLLITSRGGKRWIVPKGIVEPGLSPWDSATKEAAEEAGVAGRVTRCPVKTYRYKKWDTTLEVDVYLLEVTAQFAVWPEADTRTRKWFSLKDAAETIDIKSLRKVIAKLDTLV